MKRLFRKKSVKDILADLALSEKNDVGGLRRNLRLRDLVSFGIAAVVGAGIFSTIGNASAAGGPAVIFLFMFTALACLFSAFCYAEFASTVPISGSAYTYAYTTFGELVAWILGWALVMEYAVGNIAIAISWSDYFTSLLDGLGLHIPDYFSMDYLSASRANTATVQFLQNPEIEPNRILDLLSNQKEVSLFPQTIQTEFQEIKILLSQDIQKHWMIVKEAIQQQPNLQDIPKGLVEDFIHLKASVQSASLKDIPSNMGIVERELTGYFAWKNAYSFSPSIKLIADLPALGVITFITGLVYVGIKESKVVGNVMVIVKLCIIFLVLVVGAFYVKPENWSPFAPNGLSGVLKGVSAVFFAYIGFDAISTTAEECHNPERDLPKAMIYSLIICTILYILIALVLTGMISYKELAVGDPLAFVFKALDLNFMAGLVAISAVIAMSSVFLVFQLGQPRILMVMSKDGLLPPAFARVHKKFKTPYFATLITGLMVALPALFMNLTEVTDLTSIGTLFAFALVSGGVLLIQPDADRKPYFKVPYYSSRWIIPSFFILLFSTIYYFYPHVLSDFIPTQEASWLSILYHKFPILLFLIFAVVITFFCITKKLSVIPVLGVLSNFYLMTELGVQNWIGFGIWMSVGLIIYFSYGYWNSKLTKG